MATIKESDFGSILFVSLEHYDQYLIRLNFDLDLGNNFSYSHYIDAIFTDMKKENRQDHLIEWLHNNLNLCDDLILISANNKELNTNGSDFFDHARSLWSNYCELTY